MARAFCRPPDTLNGRLGVKLPLHETISFSKEGKAPPQTCSKFLRADNPPFCSVETITLHWGLSVAKEATAAASIDGFCGMAKWLLNFENFEHHPYLSFLKQFGSPWRKQHSQWHGSAANCREIGEAPGSLKQCFSHGTFERASALFIMKRRLCWELSKCLILWTL